MPKKVTTTKKKVATSSVKKQEPRLANCITALERAVMRFTTLDTKLAEVIKAFGELLRALREDIPRSLVTARVPVDDAVRFAVKRTEQIQGHVFAVEQMLLYAPQAVQEDLEEILQRFLMEKKEQIKVLKDLRVTIIPVRSGDRFNADIHEVIAKLEPIIDKASGTISRVHSDVYQYHDQWLKEQTIPARVEIFFTDKKKPHAAMDKKTLLPAKTL